MIEALPAIAERSPFGLSDDELVHAIDLAHAYAQQLTAWQLALVRELDVRGLAVKHGASSPAVWVRERMRVSHRTAKAMVELAERVDTQAQAVADALADAAVNREQAEVIAKTIADLAPQVGIELRAKAEQHLVGLAAEHGPEALHRLGSRILSHIAPQVAEEAERRALEEAEARAFKARGLTLSPDGTGKVRLAGWLDTEAAAVVNAALDPLCRPGNTTAMRMPPPSGQIDADEVAAPLADPRTPAQKRADALVEVCKLALTHGDLPDRSGGDRPQIVVTMRYDDLAATQGIATLDNGRSLTPEAARRLACDSLVIPAVLGTRGELLDLGRARRLFTGAVRRALVLRDGGCAFPGCDRPSQWCDCHHIDHWAEGGHTSAENGVLLCGYHHRLIHHGEWTVRMGEDGLPEFTPPKWIDPSRRARRNVYHRRL